MFYQEGLDEDLRLGDIVKGYILAGPIINSPINNIEENNFKIDVIHPEYSVVISPCCSIEEKSVLLTPLTGLLSIFYKNKYFIQDFTRINRIMEPQNAFPEDVWNGFTNEEKSRRSQVGLQYAFVDYFIFNSHDLLQKYTVNRREGNVETNYYMIDFRKIFRIECGKALKIFKSKILQLSIQTREELRNKISYYYQRPAKEDIT